ncbi:hypothetical protein LCGC14_2077610 [marine sediment metagenome]|uniref:Transposase n=1 Tax=marine sediment metagenome TaxID=412755 RepID=A0A0F9HDG5_9ZZZZ
MTPIVRGFKMELNPTKEQDNALRNAGGCARKAYNWALARINDRVSKIDSEELHKEWNVWKKENALWTREVTKCAPQEAFTDLCRAWKNFFENPEHWNRPRWRDKHRKKDRFRVNKGWKVCNDQVWVPKIGWIYLKEKFVDWDKETNILTKRKKNGEIKFKGRVLSMSLSTKAGKWFVSFQLESAIDPEPVRGPICGIDLGITTFATISSAGKIQEVEGPKALRRALKKLARLHRQLSRKKKGSKNREKAKRALARQHLKVANRRKDFHHKLSCELTKAKSLIKMETLNIAGMMRNPHLAKHIQDMGWSEFIRQLKYKAYWYGSQVGFIGRWEPSTKRCSCCGTLKPMTLSDRIYECDNCGLVMGRDKNSAINVEQCDKYEVHVPKPYIPKKRNKKKNGTGSSLGTGGVKTANDCGESSGGGLSILVASSHDSLKQEFC